VIGAYHLTPAGLDPARVAREVRERVAQEKQRRVARLAVAQLDRYLAAVRRGEAPRDGNGKEPIAAAGLSAGASFSVGLG